MKLRVIGVNIHLSIGEMEILQRLQEGADLTESEALDEVIAYKREQALMYEQQGNLALSKQLLQDIDEWDDSRSRVHADINSTPPPTIIMPD